MARVEHEREDLLREATALRERAALIVPGFADVVTCGFRPDDASAAVPSPEKLSIYFGQDPVYHFDAEGRLRRAFAADSLYRSQGTTLARLTRMRTKQETTLARHDLTDSECDQFLMQMMDHLRRLSDSLGQGTATVQAQVPADFDLRPKLIAALKRVLSGPPRLAPRLKR